MGKGISRSDGPSWLRSSGFAGAACVATSALVVSGFWVIGRGATGNAAPITAEAREEPRRNEVRRAVGESVVLAGCEVTVTSARFLPGRLVVETTAAEQGPGAAGLGRCMDWRVRAGDGPPSWGPSVATSSTTEERGQAEPTGAAMMLEFNVTGREHDLAVVFVPEGAGETVALWPVGDNPSPNFE